MLATDLRVEPSFYQGYSITGREDKGVVSSD